MKKINIDLRKLDKDDNSEFIEFHYKRLHYEDLGRIVDYYNREFDIGETGEILQVIFLIMLHKTFIKHLEQSPIKIVDNNKLILNGRITEINGKIKLSPLKKVN